MKRIWNWFLYKDAHLDWLKHLTLGTLGYLFALGLMEYIQDNISLSLTIAMFFAVALGVGKEIYDKFKGKLSEGIDIIWTVVLPTIITIIILIA